LTTSGAFSFITSSSWSPWVKFIDGSIRCWGQGHHGRLGLGSVDDIGDNEAPVAAPLVDVGEVVETMALGRVHSCAILESGNVRCWGLNEEGQLGYGTCDQLGAENICAVGDEAGEAPSQFPAFSVLP
jgi:alpha-tubulin suppressor-like RCC1 family protein